MTKTASPPRAKSLAGMVRFPQQPTPHPDTDTTNVGVGTRFGHFDGLNGHDFAVSYALSDDDGERTANDALLAYDYTRNIDDRLYGFGNLRASMMNSPFEDDYFAGAGLGYRVVNSGPSLWRVQGGPRWRVPHDTGILYSETDTMISNDLA